LIAAGGQYAINGANINITHATLYPLPEYVLEGIPYGPGGIYTGTLKAISPDGLKYDVETGEFVKILNDRLVMTV
jgi:hypothetical protein